MLYTFIPLCLSDTHTNTKKKEKEIEKVKQADGHIKVGLKFVNYKLLQIFKEVWK